MGGSSGSNVGSLFRVGESISVAHVLVFLSFLVVFIVLLEQILHKIEHSAKRSHKHEEMLRKVYRELMILGFIGVAIKVYKEVTHISAYSTSIIAFQVADLTIFILAVALILQALCVFLALRQENYELEKAELISSGDLAITMAQRRREQTARLDWPRWWLSTNQSCSDHKAVGISDGELHDLIELRVLRHLFLRRYGLPELFPFSKYVRQAQDNQITHMIDVEISMWLLLLGVGWAIDGGIVALKQVHGYAAESHAIVVVFLIFSWTLVVLHILVATYFRRCLVQLLMAGGYKHRDGHAVACLAVIGEDEDTALGKEMASDALEAMQEVQERQEAKHRRLKLEHRSKRHYLVERDTGFQLLALAFRHLMNRCRRSESTHRGDETRESRVDSNVTVTATASTATPTASFDLSTYDVANHPTVERPPRRRSAELSVRLRWFSRKAWQFGVTMLLMLNGFYLALLSQCVFYQFGSLRNYSVVLRVAVVLGLPLPVLLNMVYFQPQILRNFMIISSIVQVDVTTLSKVVTHFSEIVELRAEFVRSLLASLSSHGVTVAQLQQALEAKDRPRRSGVIELEQLRLVLRSVGFRLSHFRFNSVARLLFQLKDTKVEYAQVLRMIALAQEDEAGVIHDSNVHGSHLLLRQSVFLEEEADAHENRQEDSGDRERETMRVGDGDAMTNDTRLAFGSVRPAAGGFVDGESGAMARRRTITRRQSSFQNTSVRTLRSLYRLDTNEPGDVGDPVVTDSELSSPSNATAYVRV